MGSIHYDFLNESILFNRVSIENEFKNESDERLARKLNNYREYIKKNIQNIAQDIKESESPLRVFSTNGITPLSLLKQTALYINQFIVSDPLFRHTQERSGTAAALNKYIGMEKTGINKADIAQAVKYLKDLTPMIAGDFVKVFPTEFYKEPPKELILKH
ncbi:hypothetical protein [Chitinophaga polysaccharea]|uniref:hypothetical protein n=1 Tax=Chitinophaga polysaccharea TaxID=1293035 RepID=UPI001156C7EF|nr:hypothetical protein [Chitinophaga polysaccharea]